VVGEEIRNKTRLSKGITIRVTIGFLCVGGLVAVFLFQHVNGAAIIGVHGKTAMFLVNRSIRFLLNDVFAIGLIYAIFVQRKYVIFSLWVQVAGMVLILIPYFILKIFFIGYNGPLISFLHRLVMNPTLLILLIPAFYYQQSIARTDSKTD
jgi:exosortase F-associated protein